MTERPGCIRAVNHRHQQRIRRDILDRIRFLALLDDRGRTRNEIRLDKRIVELIELDYGVSFFEHIGHRVNNAGSVPAVDNPHLREAVRAGRDIDKITCAYQCPEDSRIDQHVLIIHLEDVCEAVGVIFKPLKSQAVSKTVNSLRAPSEDAHHSDQIRRGTDAKVCRPVLHVIIAVPEQDTASLGYQFVSEIFNSFQFSHNLCSVFYM